MKLAQVRNGNRSQNFPTSNIGHPSSQVYQIASVRITYPELSEFRNEFIIVNVTIFECRKTKAWYKQHTLLKYTNCQRTVKLTYGCHIKLLRACYEECFNFQNEFLSGKSEYNWIDNTIQWHNCHDCNKDNIFRDIYR